MKNIYTTLRMSLIIVFSLLFLYDGSAQAPQYLSYQAVSRDGDDQLVTGSAVGIKISILQGSADGAPVYIETHAPVTNENGLASIMIGDGITENFSFASIDWSAGPYFLKMETDPAGGTNYTITGTTQLLSVPYALYAEEAASTTEKQGLTAESYYGTGLLFLQNDDTSYVSIPGLDEISFELPHETTVMLHTSGSAYLTSWNAYSSMRVAIFINGELPSKGAMQVLSMVSDDNISSGGSIWSILFPVTLPAGSHTVSIKVKSGTTLNQSEITIDNNGYFDNSELNLIY